MLGWASLLCFASRLARNRRKSERKEPGTSSVPSVPCACLVGGKDAIGRFFERSQGWGGDGVSSFGSPQVVGRRLELPPGVVAWAASP